MGAKENLELVGRLRKAGADGDLETYGACIADDAVWRMAGVPAGMGGVTKGREAVLAAVSQAGPGWFDVKDEFADDDHVCVIGRLTAESFSGNEHLRGSDVSFSTYQCLVYRVADGKVTECTAYVNWLDPYVQVGLVDPGSLAR
jgi:ketosteroid isomerase-like protein